MNFQKEELKQKGAPETSISNFDFITNIYPDSTNLGGEINQCSKADKESGLHPIWFKLINKPGPDLRKSALS